jgi:ribonuclease HII
MQFPNFSYERKLFKNGYKLVAGVDEVGRGCFAGPLITGCVVFPAEFNNTSFKSSPEVAINDSKKLSPRQREKSAEWIKNNALSWGIGEISTQKINSIGMSKAAKMAFRRAISEARKKLKKPIDYLLADAFFISYVPGLPAKRRKDKKGRFYKKANGRQLAIVNGDEKSFSIAAASIIAKVYRDELMQKLAKTPKYNKYGWGRNKGYGTKEHQKAIKKYGITRLHRKAFVNTWLSKA